MAYFITTLNASITQKKRAVFYKKKGGGCYKNI